MRRIRWIGMIAVLVLAGTACGGDNDGGAATSPTAAGNTVDIADSEFKPKTITVKAGTEVVWTQSGSAPHSVTADDGSFDSSPGCLQDQSKCTQKGSEYKRAFPTAGTFNYYCVIHGGKGGIGMAGTVTVTA